MASCRLEKTPVVEARLPVDLVAELPVGREGGRGYGNDTCNTALRCAKGLCVP